MHLKVAFFGVESYDRSFIPERAEGLEFVCFEELLTDATIEKARGYDAISLFVHDRVLERSSIQKLAEMGIKMIALRSAGFNHVNTEACAEFGIRVVSVPSYSPASIAEFAVALLFDLGRRITRKALDIKSHYNFGLSEAFIGYEIRGRNVAVIGTGKIGKIFAEAMKGVGANVSAFDVYRDEAWSSSKGIPYHATVADAVKEADIISLHIPSMPSTFHLINDQVLNEFISRPVILINTSRGDLIDTPSLLRGLKSGKVMAAGLDVLEGEVEIMKGNISDEVRELLQHPNVIFTPHMAYFTREALHEIWTTSFTNLSKFYAQEPIDKFYIRA